MKSKRKPEDTCLMCHERLATKKKSHIISKFFANSFLTDGKGHKISAAGVKQNVIQDSPKENYLFCPQCESFLEYIETQISPYLANYHSEKLSEEEKEAAKTKLISKQFEDINDNLFHLFFYSLILRASISTHEVYRHFEIPKETLEIVRLSIMEFYSESGADLNIKTQELKMKRKLIYGLFTCVNFPNDSVCGLSASSTDKFHILVMNKFAIFLTNEDKGYFTDITWNNELNDKLVTLLKFETWKKLFIELHFEIMFMK